MARFTIVFTVVALAVNGVSAQAPITLPKQSGWVGAVSFAPDRPTLAIGTSDGGVTLWDMTRREKIAVLQRHQDAVAALAWSPDGGMLVSGGHDGVAILHTISRTKVAGAHELFKGHQGAVMSAVFAPNGKRFFTGSIDATIREWDMGKRVGSNILREHQSWVNGLAFDRTGALLASAASDNTVRVRKHGRDEHIRFEVPDGEIRAVAFSPDGKRVAGGIRYGGVRVWDLESKAEVIALKSHAGETWAVAFTPDGKTLASGGGDWNQPGEVRLWDVATWKERAMLKHTGEVLCLSISVDGRWLAAGGWDGNVCVWDLTK